MSPAASRVRQRRTARLVLGFVVACIASTLLLSGDGISGAALAQETTPDKSSGSESPSASPSGSSSPSGSASSSPSSASPSSASPSESTSSSAAPTSRTLAIEASRRAVTWPGRVTLTGRISSEDPSCEDFELVRIRHRIYDTETEVDLRNVLTGQDGTFSVTFRARQSAEYRAIAPAQDGCAEASSALVTVLVRVSVSISGDTSPKRGETVRIMAAIDPRHPGTAVVLQRRKGGRFVRVAGDQVDEHGRAVFRIVASWRGTRAFRAWWPVQDHDDHEAGRSSVLEIRVGPR